MALLMLSAQIVDNEGGCASTGWFSSMSFSLKHPQVQPHIAPEHHSFPIQLLDFQIQTTRGLNRPEKNTFKRTNQCVLSISEQILHLKQPPAQTSESARLLLHCSLLGVLLSPGDC